MYERERFGRDWSADVPASDAWTGPVVLRLLRSRSPKNVLDLGCGNGSLAWRIAREGFNVSGVDWDPKAIRLATERVPEGNFTVAEFNDDPPRTDFDAVVSTEVIEHLFNPDELLQFASRALRPGGTLILSTPYHGYWKNLAISLVDGWDKHFMAGVLAGHIKFFSRATLTAALERNGFAVERFRGAGRVPFLWKSMVLAATKCEPAVSSCD